MSAPTTTAAWEPAEGEGASWRPVEEGVLLCSRDGHHHERAGSFDESARRLSHSELAVATQLVAEGHHVTSLAVRRGGGPMADLDVCGERVEVKSLLPLVERGGYVPTHKSVYNRLAGAKDQAAVTVLYAKQSGLSETAAEAGIELFVARRRWGQIAAVRVLGDGFDRSWSRGLDASRQATLGAQGWPQGSRRPNAATDRSWTDRASNPPERRAGRDPGRGRTSAGERGSGSGPDPTSPPAPAARSRWRGLSRPDHGRGLGLG